MRTLQFSLLALLGLVSFAAVGCAALARPNEWWASGLLTVAAAAVVVAVLAAMFRRGRSRTFAGGFAIVGGVYLLLVFGPGFGERLGPMLLTTRALAYAESKWHPDADAGGAMDEVRLFAMERLAPGSTGRLYVPPGDSGSPFQQIGHALWTLMLACLGGLLARCWHNGRDQRSDRNSADTTAVYNAE